MSPFTPKWSGRLGLIRQDTLGIDTPSFSLKVGQTMSADKNRHSPKALWPEPITEQVEQTKIARKHLNFLTSTHTIFVFFI